MTKYKKLTRSTFAIVALCLALVGILAFGGTYAYFSDKASASDTATLGTLEVNLLKGSDAVTIFADDEIVQPNQEILNEELTISKGSTNINFYARVKITATVAAAGEHADGCGDAALTAADIVAPSIDGWVLEGGYYYQGDVNTDTAVINSADVKFTPSVVLNALIGDGGCTAYMGKTVTVQIDVEVLQADYLTSTTTPASGYTVAELAAAWADKV